jgi:hypothetical protein
LSEAGGDGERVQRAESVAGLMLTGNSPSELQEQLDEILWQILEGMSRVSREWEGFASFGAIDDSIDAIRRVMIDKIDAAGIAS